jgi:hypothetical protein
MTKNCKNLNSSIFSYHFLIHLDLLNLQIFQISKELRMRIQS